MAKTCKEVDLTLCPDGKCKCRDCEDEFDCNLCPLFGCIKFKIEEGKEE